jgi:zinc D-Ala-D-Ala carboxypeptidase
VTTFQWTMIKHFKSAEFDSPDMPGSGTVMDFGFVKALDTLREACGFPFVIHSGFRTVAHNAQLSGAVGDSAHLKGMAADIGAATSAMRFKLVQAALAAGFKRIGIGKDFVHLDLDTALPQNVIWLYS